MNAPLTPITVICDSPLVLHGLAHVINPEPDLQIVTSVSRVGDHRSEGSGVEVVLLNLQLSTWETSNVVTQLHRQGHAVIVLSVSETQSDVVQCIKAGARGYLGQRIGEEELLTAIRAVASGRSYFSARFNGRGLPVPPLHLTDRERQILQLLASGATDREIAGKLDITENTVHSHLDRLRSKSGFRRRADLTRLALRYGLTGD
ncbi:LuxR C-terminal-related transcriptional regulator [Streptomyces chattanoogensis]|uniref:LuxR C-terminal-related transcriptional regulator n=1 Tax=Streptomyces chattanoogensis TaxID=66876 RepID=UPI0036821842